VSSRVSSLRKLDCQVLLRSRFYFDRSTKFPPQKIVAIQIARPLPHRTDLTAVFNFIGQRVSDTRVNFGVQDQDMRRKPFNFCGPRGGLRRISSTGAYLSLPLNLFCGTHWRNLGYLNDCWTLLDRRHAVWRNWATTVRTAFPHSGYLCESYEITP
jgi:hypothetical protein